MTINLQSDHQIGIVVPLIIQIWSTEKLNQPRVLHWEHTKAKRQESTTTRPRQEWKECKKQAVPDIHSVSAFHSWIPGSSSQGATRKVCNVMKFRAQKSLLAGICWTKASLVSQKLHCLAHEGKIIRNCPNVIKITLHLFYKFKKQGWHGDMARMAGVFESQTDSISPNVGLPRGFKNVDFSNARLAQCVFGCPREGPLISTRHILTSSPRDTEIPRDIMSHWHVLIDEHRITKSY